MFSAFYKIVCSGLMAPAVHCLTEVMTQFFIEVKRQLATCEFVLPISTISHRTESSRRFFFFAGFPTCSPL